MLAIPVPLTVIFIYRREFQKKKEIATPDIQQNPVHERAKGKLISYF